MKHRLGQSVLGDCLKVMPRIKDSSVQLIWTDPPFNTGTMQKHLKGASYSDKYTGNRYMDLLREVAIESRRVLTDSGSLFMLLDFRSVHQAKVMLDGVFSPELFQGEIIWFSELGASRRHGKGWTVRHCTILWYTKTPAYRFHFDRVPMVPRKAPKPGYEGPKPISSVWTYTMSNTAKERVPYPSQKPLAIIEPMVLVHTDVGDTVLDPFAGSGSVAEAAAKNDRRFIAIDQNPEALTVIRARIAKYDKPTAC